MTIRIADHPRASAAVRRARNAAGLAGFLLGAYLAHKSGLPSFDVVLRALLAGIGAHVAGWALAITYWRGAILAELETARRAREASLQEAADHVLREAAASQPV